MKRGLLEGTVLVFLLLLSVRALGWLLGFGVWVRLGLGLIGTPRAGAWEEGFFFFFFFFLFTAWEGDLACSGVPRVT
jgi:hypothetical protein